MPSSATLRLAGPFDLAVLVEAAACFLPRIGPVATVLRVATDIGRRPAIIEIPQTSRMPPIIEASSTIPVHRHQLLGVAQWLVSAELDLAPVLSHRRAAARGRDETVKLDYQEVAP